MKENPGGGGRRILPDSLAKRVIELYRRGRAKFVSARYGNPAGVVRVIAITGEYGKTTTALLLSAILKEAGRSAVRYQGDVSSESVDFAAELQRDLKRARQTQTEFFIIEITPELVSSSALSGVTLDTVVVTSPAAEADALLKEEVNYAVVPDDYEAGMLAIAEHQIITFGEKETAEAKIDKTTLFRKGTEVEMTIDHHTSLTVATHLVGTANAHNVAAAVASAYVLGAALNTVEEGAAQLEQVDGNYQYLDGERPYTVVVDRAVTDRSIDFVVDSAKELARRRLVVALEASAPSEEMIKNLKKKSDRLVLVSRAAPTLPGVEVVESVEEAWIIVQRAAKKDDTVLLIGQTFVDQAREFSKSEKESN